MIGSKYNFPVKNVNSDSKSVIWAKKDIIGYRSTVYVINL